MTIIMFALEMIKVSVSVYLLEDDPLFAITTLKVVAPVLSTKPAFVEVIEYIGVPQEAFVNVKA